MIELVDDRLRLRPWQDGDAMALLEAVRESSDTVGRWLPWCHADYNFEDATNWVTYCRSAWAAGDHFAFAIFDKMSGELMGAMGLTQHDRLHRRANLGYWVRQSRQRQGVSTAAVPLVAKFGFETLGLIRIEIVALPLNQASRRTAAKSGAQFDGIASRRMGRGEQRQNAAIYALTPAALR